MILSGVSAEIGAFRWFLNWISSLGEVQLQLFDLAASVLSWTSDSLPILLLLLRISATPNSSSALVQLAL